MKIKNPILSGFYPDPSICAVGEDFYLVNSTFAYFPGVPIFHSKDLAHWEQIGNILDRKSQLPLNDCGHSAGIYAPTIRYYDGKFYMITTNVSGGGNFIVTAEKPEGPWSEPYYLGQEAQGIDPSLFFDEDGKCYYVGTRSNSEGSKYYGDNEIWLQELDLVSMKLTGSSQILWRGAFQNAVWAEGPHLYKVNGYYYLMIAEGGTGPNHGITIARSKALNGPYESNQNNPILTHRHLGKEYPIVYVGHGDLVEAYDGSWYIVMLASRPCGGYTNMGRETFLAKVTWEDGWPVINPFIGKLEDYVEVSLKEKKVIPQDPVYHFDGKKLPHAFVMLRNPEPDMYSLEENTGYLRLYLRPEALRDKKSPSFIGLRQTHHNYQVNTKMEFGGIFDNESAGLAIIQSNEYHVRFEICQREGHRYVALVSCIKGKDNIVAESEIRKSDEKEAIFMKIVNQGQKADFYYKLEEEWIILAKDMDIHFLSTEVAGGFTGCVVGMYASSNGKASNSFVDYPWFSYTELQ